MSDKKETSKEGLKSEHFTRQRDEASKEGVRGLLIINGGSAVALLAFLQAIWLQDKLLAKYVVLSISILALGVLFGGLSHFLRYHASYNYQRQREKRFWWFRRGYMGSWYISLTLFLFGISVVLFGAWCRLSA
jgi:hypothetical protein